MINGVLIVQKETGFTSHDVVAKLRGICGQRKIGHTGTLDPNATGVLPVCLGNATKLCDMMTDHDKEYVATLELGKVTDTQDIWGEVLESSDAWKDMDEAYILGVIASFTGKQMQVPPMYSALKVDGKKLYELAREGKVVERKAREVTFYEIEVLSMELPCITMRVACSKGTYIRTLCHDIGEKLGCGACMSGLERTKVGSFTKEMSYTLGQLQEMKDQGTLNRVFYPVERCFLQYPAKQVKEPFQKYLNNGNRLGMQMVREYEPMQVESKKETAAKVTERGFTANQSMANGIRITEHYTYEEAYRIYNSEGVFYGVYIPDENGLKPWKMFLPE